jgi:fructose-bisphosphate aldolase class 1
MIATTMPGLAVATAQALIVDDRGFLAIDASTGTRSSRFVAERRATHAQQTVEARRAYRELIVTTPDLGPSISGAILCDETIPLAHRRRGRVRAVAQQRQGHPRHQGRHRPRHGRSPREVVGIVFLFGRQTPQVASARLSTLNARSASSPPWRRSFSFCRAIQEPALETWTGNAANVIGAQRTLTHRADYSRAARGPTRGCRRHDRHLPDAEATTNRRRPDARTE